MDVTTSKVCCVCGDKALGFNFNAVTCESCKAFFRRNATTAKELQCVFDGKCNITRVTRRFCQKCRLEKCFSIGMRKDLIMSEEDKVRKRRKIEENREKRKTYGGFKKHFKKMKKDESNEPTTFKSNDYDDHLFNERNKDSQHEYDNSNELEKDNNRDWDDSNGIEKDKDRDSSNERLVTSSDDVNWTKLNVNKQMKDTCLLNKYLNNYNSKCNNNSLNYSVESTASNNVVNFARDVIDDVQRMQSIEPEANNSIESILCEAIKLEYEAFSSITKFNSNSRELNDAETAKLNELIVAHKALLAPFDDELNDLNNFIGQESNFKKIPEKHEADPVLVGVINLTAICIRRLIKMAKKINAFKNMCQEDQVALLKGGCTEIMLLRSAMNYDPKMQTWQIPHSMEVLNVNVDILKLAKGNIYQVHDHFIRTFDPKWRSDENIILILCAVVLFTPDRPRIVHQDVIKLEQNSYYYLLRRYLESVYPGCEAKSTFLKLIQKISEVRKVNEELINVYLNVNPSQVEPLLIEIFDLKPK